jgi:hypothetical protein
MRESRNKKPIRIFGFVIFGANELPSALSKN